MAAPWGPNEYQQLVKLAYIFGGNASEIARNWIGREQEEEQVFIMIKQCCSFINWLQLRGRLKQLVLYEVNRASYLKPVFKEREAKIGKTLTSFHEFIQKLKDEEEEKEEAAQVDMLLLEARIEEGYRRELELRELHEYEHKFSVTNANQHYYHVNIDVEARQAEARALIEDRSRLRGEVSQMKVCLRYISSYSQVLTLCERYFRQEEEHSQHLLNHTTIPHTTAENKLVVMVRIMIIMISIMVLLMLNINTTKHMSTTIITTGKMITFK